MRALVVVALFAAGCGDGPYLIVTIDARPSVHNAVKLAITEANGGTMRTDTLALDGHMFPVTFSVSAPGRTGELDLSVQALDDKGAMVGLGSGMTTTDATDAMVKLDPADFVVNTDYGGDQFLTTDFETVGHQASVTTDFNWTVAFRNNMCTDSCDVFARRFDKTGAPVSTTAAASDHNFTVTSTPTQSGAFPSIAGSKLATIAVWDFTDTTGGGTGVACRGIDAAGALTPGQRSLATDVADTAMVAPLSDGNFAVAWQTTTPSVQIHTVIARPDCTSPQAMPLVVSTITGMIAGGPHRAAVANNGAAVLWVWITDDAVHVRAGNTSGTFTGGELTLYSAPPGSAVEVARVAPMGTGFAVAARLAATNGTSPGSIIVLRTLDTGQTITGSTAVTITDKSGSDFSTGHQGFSIATRADGTTMVVWHQCDDGSPISCDGNLDIYGRTVMTDGTLPGQPVQLATTTTGNQTNPSVVALDDAFAVTWDDSSKAAPDTDGSAVRARLVYP